MTLQNQNAFCLKLYDDGQAHDFRHAAMHRLADWPVLARIGARSTDAIRLDSRAVAYLYTLASEAEWQDMNVDERDFAKAALSRDNPPHYDVYESPKY